MVQVKFRRRYRFDPEAKQRFLDLLRERFNSGVRYKGRAFKWDTVIEQKTSELGRYLVGRTSGLDFPEPSPALRRADSEELRRRILSLSQSEARNLGIAKSTLHCLRTNARSGHSFRVYRSVREKLECKSILHAEATVIPQPDSRNPCALRISS
jgi:CRISPR-associated protein Cas1